MRFKTVGKVMDVTAPKQVMILAGEASGDLYGAQLVEAIRQQRPYTRFVGMGGAAMAASGVEILVDAASVSVVGITEVIGHGKAIFKGFRVITQALKRLRPDLLILIDFPDFNLRVAKTAKQLDLPVLYYINPQIWAWRTGRVHTIRKRVDHMAVIFPFETRFFHSNAIPATYVGHPLLDHHPSDSNTPTAERFPVVGLLPGSRNQEIERHLPVLLKSLSLISLSVEKVSFCIAPASSDQTKLIKAMIGAGELPSDYCQIVEGGARAILSKCTLVIAASGTVTLEAAIAGVPMVVIYKVSPLSYLLGRSLIRVNHISLVNLIAEETVVPELVQHEASPEKIAAETIAMLTTPGRLETIRKKLKRVHQKLGKGGAAARVAEIAFQLMD